MEEHRLVTVFGSPEHMHLPPSPHSPAAIGDGSRSCKQLESCATTAAADQETLLPDSHALSNTIMDELCHGLYNTQDAKLELSLGYGDHPCDYHCYKEYFLASGASSEHSASSVTELEDQSSNGGVAAKNLPLNASSCARKSGEERDSEIMPCSSPGPNQRFPSSFAASQRTLAADGSLTSSSLYDDKVFFCKFCDRQFHSSQALGGHQNAHKRERLVARSTPRLELPSFFCSALRPILSPMSNYQPQAALHMLPSCINGDHRSKSFPLVAVGERTQSAIVVPSMCTDIFEGPQLVSAPMCKTSFGRNSCMGGNNVYIIGNRSLGIKAHSLVHKPASAQAPQITPQSIGLMRGPLGWPSVGFVNRPQHGSMQTTRFAPSSLSAVSRFVGQYSTEAPCSLLHLRRQRPTPTPSLHDSTHSDISLLPCSELVDSCTASSPGPGHVDLALHL